MDKLIVLHREINSLMFYKYISDKNIGTLSRKLKAYKKRLSGIIERDIEEISWREPCIFIQVGKEWHRIENSNFSDILDNEIWQLIKRLGGSGSTNNKS